MLEGGFQEAMHCLEAALALYALLGNEQTASQGFSVTGLLSVAPPTQGQHHIHQAASLHPVAYFLIGAPPTRYLTNRATETLCWGLLALVQVNVGQVHNSIRSGRMALTLSKEIKNVSAQINSTHCLIYGLLETGAYEEAALLPLDFSSHYETEALLRGGDEGQAREEVQRLGERLGPYRRFRIPYLRSLAALADWDGQREQAIGHLSEADQLAAEIGLPGEQWQIQAALGKLYKAEGEQAQARTAFAESARIIQELAEGIGDEEMRSRFLAGPPIQQILQHQTSQLRLYYSGFSGPGWWCDGLAAS